MNTDEKIRSLKPGGSVELSRSAAGRVVAERTSDGKSLVIVRENPNGWWIIKREKW